MSRALGSRELPFKVTPYYRSLADFTDPRDPLAAMVNPDPREHRNVPELSEDPLAEDGHMAVPRLIHRYPDRALLLATDTCAVHCRFCTRRRRIGRTADPVSPEELDGVCAYLVRNPGVREVILSGGDPLTLPDEFLNALLGRIREIPSVRVVRVSTRIPAVDPERVTQPLARLLARQRPLYLSTHFNHPRELTGASRKALATLSAQGIPMANQAVLLRGINDSRQVLGDLFAGLYENLVRPYYLHQCDLTRGTNHFRTPLGKGLDLVEDLRKQLSGLAVPLFMVDLPGGGGKVPLEPSRLERKTDGGCRIRNLDGNLVEYPDAEV